MTIASIGKSLVTAAEQVANEQSPIIADVAAKAAAKALDSLKTVAEAGEKEFPQTPTCSRRVSIVDQFNVEIEIEPKEKVKLPGINTARRPSKEDLQHSPKTPSSDTSFNRSLRLSPKRSVKQMKEVYNHSKEKIADRLENHSLMEKIQACGQCCLPYAQLGINLLTLAGSIAITVLPVVLR